MQFNAAKLQKQSRFKSCFKAAFFEAASKSSAAQRSAARRMLRLKVQRSVCVNTPACKCSAAHHMLRLKATCIYSAAQRKCERTLIGPDMT